MTKQHLTGELPINPRADDILEVFRDLGCIQLDPISAVAPSQFIVVSSRLGNFDKSDLEQLLWHDKKLFEYWAHQQSIVLMEDYPLYHARMKGYPDTLPKPWGPTTSQRIRRWLTEHSDLREYVLRELKQKGPLSSRQFEDKSPVKASRFRMGLIKRCLPNAIQRFLPRRGDGRRPPGKPKAVGPLREIPSTLDLKEGAVNRRRRI